MRVKLLVDVKDTGKKGEVVQVSSALWTNVLMPKKNAIRFSDDDVAAALKKEQDKEAEELATARQIESELLATKIVTFKRKVGQNRQLFGAATGKQISEYLKQHYPRISSKAVIESLTPEDPLPDSLVNNEIRKSGQYKAILALHPKVAVSFTIEVIPEV